MRGEPVAKLVWRVKLVAELEPGVVTETELARIERDAQAGLAELGLQLDEAKRLTAALQARRVPAQVDASGECRRACEACGRALASQGHYEATVPFPVRRGSGACPTAARRPVPGCVRGEELHRARPRQGRAGPRVGLRDGPVCRPRAVRQGRGAP